MVRVTQVLARIPVIKFRKGGGGSSHPSGPSPAQSPAASVASPASAPVQMQTASPMSTSSIPDIDLPLRYKRIPLSEEEIALINGGGIV